MESDGAGKHALHHEDVRPLLCRWCTWSDRLSRGGLPGHKSSQGTARGPAIPRFMSTSFVLEAKLEDLRGGGVEEG